MGEFKMPSLGADMEHGHLVEWMVDVGDTVERGDIVAVVGTDKSDIDVEVFEGGVVRELLVDVGTEVAVGTPLAWIATDHDEATTPPPPAAEPPAVEPPAPATPATAVEPPAAPTSPAAPPTAVPTGGHVRSSPRARRLAQQAGIDLAEVAGSGPSGAVTASDLDHLAGDDRDRAQAVTARLMARSAREIPHYYLVTTVDLGPAVAWLTEHNRDRPAIERVVPAALLLHATSRALREVPGFNGTWNEGFVPAPHVHLGVAISLRGGGLVAPAILDADTLDVDETMAALDGLVRRARAGRLLSAEASAATATVTNLGDGGAEEVLGVIPAPQVALIGFGRVVERPVAVDGRVEVRPTVRASLAGDHRVTDGHTGSRLLDAIARHLAHPEATP